MKKFKRALGVAMSVAMLGAQAMPALAAGVEGTGNILDYKVDTVVVPTTMKIALNPNGYEITTKYVKTADAAIDASKTYYTESSGTYTKVASPVVSDIGTYYEAVTSTDQVVSLNYGIANKATADKTVTIEIAANYETIADKTAITFVDTAAKATGAEKDELKMYLAVVSAKALPTADTYAKAAAFESGKTYYTKDGSGVFAVAGTQPMSSNFADSTYYLPTTTIGVEITEAQLSDVTMTKADDNAGAQAFIKGTTNKADASIAYKLGKATYSLKDGEVIDFSTTQTQLGSKLEMSALGGVAGFTLTGAINASCDWTEAEAIAIKFVPTFTIKDATGTETAVDDTYNQVEVVPAGPSIASGATKIASPGSDGATYSVNLVNGTDSKITFTLPEGTSISKVYANGNPATLTTENTAIATFAGSDVTLKGNSSWASSAGTVKYIKVVVATGASTSEEFIIKVNCN